MSATASSASSASESDGGNSSRCGMRMRSKAASAATLTGRASSAISNAWLASIIRTVNSRASARIARSRCVVSPF